jgi:hypothetical protein
MRILPLLLLSLLGCSARKTDDSPAREGLGDASAAETTVAVDADPGFDLGARPGCKGLACQQVDCDGSDTTLTGTVFAPNGRLPLYDVIVYVPNGKVAPLPSGVQCDKCGALASGEPLVTALSDAKGRFTLKNVPVGKNVPLVIQLGKWRREVVVPEVKACVENHLDDPELTRLPKKQSEGNMPRIAVTVGSCDQVACMLPKIGIDPSEFGVSDDGDKKAVHFFRPTVGSGPLGPDGMEEARNLWSNTKRLDYYDMAIFSCECGEYPQTKDATSYAAVADYLAHGGRIFTTDFQYTWYKYSPDAQLAGAATIPGGAPTGGNPVVLKDGFPKGKALADWMQFVDPIGSYGSVQCDIVFNNLASLDTSKAQLWGSSSGGKGEAGPGDTPKFMTINTPVGSPPEKQCGKAVHLDAHVNNTDVVDATYPAGCKSALKSAELAFAFFFFDLASCIQKESDMPQPPPIK